jgi:hypothetical protein
MSVEKPYRTNQSSLDKFLGKRGKVPSKGIYINHTRLERDHFEKLSTLARKAYDENDFEALARLDAVGCDVQLGVLISTNKSSLSVFKNLEKLQESDKYDNMWRGSMSTIYGSYVHMITGKPADSYTVAGKIYASKTEFLLSRTPLGKTLV